jgi:hypothetical protein
MNACNIRLKYQRFFLDKRLADRIDSIPLDTLATMRKHLPSMLLCNCGCMDHIFASLDRRFPLLRNDCR